MVGRQSRMTKALPTLPKHPSGCVGCDFGTSRSSVNCPASDPPSRWSAPRAEMNDWLKVGGIGFEPEDVRPESDYQLRRSAREVEFGLARRSEQVAVHVHTYL